MAETPVPRPRTRLLVAVAIGVASAAQTAWFLHIGPSEPDFVYWWAAARLLLAGNNPYTLLDHYDVSAAAPYDVPFGYPLPTILAIVPLAGLSMIAAAVVFSAISGAVLAYCVTRRAWWPLLMCVSAPYVIAVSDGQWSPLIVAAAVVPRLAPMLWFKPTLGLAALAHARDRWGIGLAVLLGLATLLVLPTWPADWVRTALLRDSDHPAAISTTFGPLLLLALLRWRRRDAWVLLIMGCVPQLLFFYDQLPLWLIARSRREALALTMASMIGLVGYVRTLHPGVYWVRAAEPWVMGFLYLPALLLVLRHPNVGTVPPWIERAIGGARVPSWLRGRAPSALPADPSAPIT